MQGLWQKDSSLNHVTGPLDFAHTRLFELLSELHHVLHVHKGQAALEVHHKIASSPGWLLSEKRHFALQCFDYCTYNSPIWGDAKGCPAQCFCCEWDVSGPGKGHVRQFE